MHLVDEPCRHKHSPWEESSIKKIIFFRKGVMRRASHYWHFIVLMEQNIDY